MIDGDGDDGNGDNDDDDDGAFFYSGVDNSGAGDYKSQLKDVLGAEASDEEEELRQVDQELSYLRGTDDTGNEEEEEESEDKLLLTTRTNKQLQKAITIQQTKKTF